jgi:hypothetical protein
MCEEVAAHAWSPPNFPLSEETVTPLSNDNAAEPLLITQ